MVLGFGLHIWWLNITKRFRSAERQAIKQSKMYAKQAKIFTKTATEMGGLLIKVGQYISAQVAILPPEYLEELSKLQDAVAPEPTEKILAEIEQELGATPDALFAHFDYTPIAAASLGQVYRAHLRTGQEVAVKVLRPGIEDTITIDLRFLKDALRLINRRTSIGNYMDVDTFYAEFKSTLLDELDFGKEAANAESFQRNFLESMSIDIPRIYWEYSTRKVLTMEFMHGIKINELEQLDAAHINREVLAKNLIGVYAQMILRDGFFHADPHPGNVLVREDGTILLLDFGMVGRVTEHMRTTFIDLGIAVISNDSDKAVASLRELGFIRPGVDATALARNFMTLFERMTGNTTREDFRMSEAALDELSAFMRSQPFQWPSNIMFLGKAIITALGLTTALAPEVDLVEEVTPYVEDLMGEGATKDFLGKMLDGGKTLLASIIPTARKIVSVFDKMDSGEFQVRLSAAQEHRITSTQENGSKNIVQSIIGAALFVSGIVLLPQPAFFLGSLILLVLGGLLLLKQLVSSFGTKRKRRRHPGL